MPFELQNDDENVYERVNIIFMKGLNEWSWSEHEYITNIRYL